MIKLLNNVQTAQGSDTTVMSSVTTADNIKILISENNFQYSKKENDFEENLNLPYDAHLIKNVCLSG